MSNINFIAYYLPQFHAIPENDQWWGEGFTEWTNVRKARPLFKGHYQPHVPADLGYYNLLDPSVRIKQAELAKEYGVTGFCYWHYWFGNGKRLLEKPAREMLQSKKPDFPFCFAWANQSWTGVWHGLDNKILMEQTYPGHEDDVNHFYEVLPYFIDPRYIKVDNKPIFIFYRPFDHPYLDNFIELWQELALKEGLNGIVFLGISYSRNHSFKNLDGLIIQEPFGKNKKLNIFDKAVKKTTGRYPGEWLNEKRYNCQRISFSEMVKHTSNYPLESNQFPTILSGWDNTPRSGKRGVVFHDFTPDLFKEHVGKILNLISNRNETLCFIKSWNEWAEGNYMEPDVRFGRDKLIKFKSVLGELGVNSQIQK